MRHRPHHREIFATLVYDEGDVYPGAEALGSYAQVECWTPFEVVGAAPVRLAQ